MKQNVLLFILDPSDCPDIETNDPFGIEIDIPDCLVPELELFFDECRRDYTWTIRDFGKRFYRIFHNTIDFYDEVIEYINKNVAIQDAKKCEELLYHGKYGDNPERLERLYAYIEQHDIFEDDLYYEEEKETMYEDLYAKLDFLEYREKECRDIVYPKKMDIYHEGELPILSDSSFTTSIGFASADLNYINEVKDINRMNVVTRDINNASIFNIPLIWTIEVEKKECVETIYHLRTHDVDASMVVRDGKYIMLAGSVLNEYCSLISLENYLIHEREVFLKSVLP